MDRINNQYCNRRANNQIGDEQEGPGGRSHIVLEYQPKVAKEILRVPAYIQSNAEAQRITYEQKRVCREACKRLLRKLALRDDRSLDQVRLVRVMGQVFAQAIGEVPNADHKQRQHYHLTHR